ncbi:MAG: archease [Candidatus Micrarchaeia archaeon]
MEKRHRFRYLPHTAEIKFKAYGNNFSSAIESAAAAMLNVMLDIKKIERSNAIAGKISIVERASTREELVWYTLQDILSKVDEKTLNAYEFKVLRIKEGKSDINLKGVLLFRKVKEDFHLLEVKAVTPSELSVKEGSRWSISVILDV